MSRFAPRPSSCALRALRALALCLAAGLALSGAPTSRADGVASEKKEKLADHVRPFAADFGKHAKDEAKIVSGPTAVKMPNDKSPGRRWMVSLGKTTFKVTTQDSTKLGAKDVLERLQQVPPTYRRAFEIVSEGEKAGVAIYADLGGAAAHGSQEYLNIIPQANAFVLCHESGHILEQRTSVSKPRTLEEWKAAIAKDKVSVSDYGDEVAHEDLAEFALMYAISLDAGPTRLEELKALSPTRFAQWEGILRTSGAVTDATTAPTTGK